jgi:hypothetical protein
LLFSTRPRLSYPPQGGWVKQSINEITPKSMMTFVITKYNRTAQNIARCGW